MIQLSQEVEALAKRLSAAQSLSIEEAIRLALEEGLIGPKLRYWPSWRTFHERVPSD